MANGTGHGKDASTLGWSKFMHTLATRGPRARATVRLAQAQIGRLISQGRRR